MKDDVQTIVACFTVSNDSIRIYDLPSSRRNAMWGITNREKMPRIRIFFNSWAILSKSAKYLISSFFV